MTHNAPIYVIDIGLYLLPLLQTIYPSLTFIPFTSHAELPHHYEPIDLTGVGFFEYTPGEPIVDPFKTMTGPTQSLQLIRDVIFQQLNHTPSPQCIILVSRQLQEENLNSFHDKHTLDEMNESPGMNSYHDTGPGMHSAFLYYATTAQERRKLLNEHEIFQELVHIFHDKYHQCVQLIQLDKLSIREQFLVFMNAKLVLGQHGAALTYSGFMSNLFQDTSILVELDPQYNWNFKLECEGMGVDYLHLQRDEYPGLYLTEDHVNIDLSGKKLIKILKKILKEWKGSSWFRKGKKGGGEEMMRAKEVMGSYWETLYETGVYNGVEALPSRESIGEKESFLQRTKSVAKTNLKQRSDKKKVLVDDDDEEDDEDDDLEFDDEEDDGDDEEDDDDDGDEDIPPQPVEVCQMKNGKKFCRWK
jgi:hypothetical protein